MNVIYFGNYKDLTPYLQGVVTIPSDLSQEEFNQYLWDYRYRKGQLTLVFHLPLNEYRQNQILKFSEEAKFNIVLFSPRFVSRIIPTILTRFTLKISDVYFNPDMFWGSIKSKFEIDSFNILSYPMLSRYKNTLSRSEKLLLGYLDYFDSSELH